MLGLDTHGRIMCEYAAASGWAVEPITPMTKHRPGDEG